MARRNWLAFNAITNCVVCCVALAASAWEAWVGNYLFAAIMGLLAITHGVSAAFRLRLLRRNRAILAERSAVETPTMGPDAN